MNPVTSKIHRLHWFLSSQLGINIRTFLYAIVGFPKFVRDYFRFNKNNNDKIEFMPCLTDWREAGGDTKSEYFLQDLYVAQKIFRARPDKHVDIGSRVDGFVAHVASFRSIEVFDIRPTEATVSGIQFKKEDLMNPSSSLRDYSDSVSCLHTLEHFGLGRYGDPIDPKGYEVGLKNMSQILKKDGTFYLSTPIGEARVIFNANRIFDPRNINRLANENALELQAFAWIEDGSLKESNNFEVDFDGLSQASYALGIFTFRKL